MPGMGNPQVAARVPQEVAAAVEAMRAAGLPTSELLAALAVAWDAAGGSVPVMRTALDTLSAGAGTTLALQEARAALEDLRAEADRVRRQSETEARRSTAAALQRQREAEDRAQVAEERARLLGEAVGVAQQMRAAALAPSDAVAMLAILRAAKVGVSELPAHLQKLGGVKRAADAAARTLASLQAEAQEAEARRDRARAEASGAARERDLVAAHVSSAVRLATESATIAAGTATDRLQEVATEALQALRPIIHLVGVREALEGDIAALRAEAGQLGLALAPARQLHGLRAEHHARA